MHSKDCLLKKEGIKILLEKNIFINIVNKTLNEKYNKLEHYQELCTNILNKRPNTITQCKKVLKTIYVNIWDIVDEK